MEGVKRVEAYAFFGCDALEAVALGDASQVMENAFGNCPALAAVTAKGRVDFAKGNETAKALL